MEEKHKAMLELAAKAIGEARELFAEQRNARAASIKGACGAGNPAASGGSGAATRLGATAGGRSAEGAAANGALGGNPASGPGSSAGAAGSAAPDAADVRLLSLVDGSGLGWLMEDDAERGRFLEELEARIAAAAGASSDDASGK